MSPKKNLSQINYLSPIKYLLAIMFCLKDQLKIFWLRPVKYLSERSIDNTSASHIWKIKGHYFGLGQSSICLKDQLTILWLGLIKNLSERSVDNTSVRKKFNFFISWSDHSIKVFFSRIFLSADQISQIGSADLVKSASHIISVIYLSSAHLDKTRSNF